SPLNTIHIQLVRLRPQFEDPAPGRFRSQTQIADSSVHFRPASYIELPERFQLLFQGQQFQQIFRFAILPLSVQAQSLKVNLNNTFPCRDNHTPRRSLGVGVDYPAIAQVQGTDVDVSESMPPQKEVVKMQVQPGLLPEQIKRQPVSPLSGHL